MLNISLVGLLAIIAIFLIVVALQPADFRITRSASVAAPASIVFEQINDFHNWNAWSPWARMDPNAKNTFEGPPAGVGAIFAWAGNSKVGAGRMTITETRPNDLVLIKLEFFKPFVATNTTEFTVKPDGDQTAVNWTMTGRSSFMGKAIGMIMNCEKMVGGQFEQGLANLRSIVESPAAV
jgi:Polyketide cyclase / dehydrase and lipid transport